jgi:prepilin-type N-terminal cleavage/methylation domain-containing protein
MKNENGFSLVELLIVVAIIAIIAAIAVPSLLTSKQAANEAGAIQGCRTVGSAEIAYAATNNQLYTNMTGLVGGNFLDTRFTAASGFNGYTYSANAVTGAVGGTTVPDGFGFAAVPTPGGGRYHYGIGPDQVVRYIGLESGATAPAGMSVGDPIGKRN